MKLSNPKIFEKYKTHIQQIILVMCGAIIVIVAAFFVFPPQRIATVDLTGIVHRFTTDEVKQHLNPIELKERMKKFGSQLESVLADICKSHHVVLVPRQAVIGGARDYTNEVLQRLHENRQGNKG